MLSITANLKHRHKIFRETLRDWFSCLAPPSMLTGFGTFLFYLFSLMKSVIRERNYQCIEEIKVEFEYCVVGQDKDFFAQGIKKLPG